MYSGYIKKRDLCILLQGSASILFCIDYISFFDEADFSNMSNFLSFNRFMIARERANVRVIIPKP